MAGTRTDARAAAGVNVKSEGLPEKGGGGAAASDDRTTSSSHTRLTPYRCSNVTALQLYGKIKPKTREHHAAVTASNNLNFGNSKTAHVHI